MKKIIILTLFFYILVLLQTSFLVHFSFHGIVPNLLLVSLIIFLFLEKHRNYSGFLLAGIGGFFLGLFSSYSMAVPIISLILVAFLMKKVLKVLGEENIIFFLPVFLVAFILYNVFSVLINSIFTFTFPSFCLNKLIFFEIFYNFIIGISGYLLIKTCFPKVLKR